MKENQVLLKVTGTESSDQQELEQLLLFSYSSSVFLLDNIQYFYFSIVFKSIINYAIFVLGISPNRNGPLVLWPT